MKRENLAVFDFDGTLARIVRHPSKARIGAREKAALASLSRKCKVVILTGREKGFVQWQVKGTGAEVLGLCGNPARRKSAAMKRLEALALRLARRGKGLSIESKPSGFTLHFRNSRLGREGALAKMQKALPLARKCAKMVEGRRALEFLPKGARTKAETLEILVGLAAPARAVFIGDDQSDCEAIKRCSAHRNFSGALVRCREVRCAGVEKIAMGGIFRFAREALGC